MEILLPCSLGELYDKITILQIKSNNISDPKKKANVQKELKSLLKIAEEYPINPDLHRDLLMINREIWDIEDGIRIEEKNKDYGDDFIQLARSVYFKNDRRAEIKKEINIQYGSNIVEEKSYEEYN